MELRKYLSIGLIGLASVCSGCATDPESKTREYQGPPLDRHGPEGFDYRNNKTEYQGPPLDRHGPEGFDYRGKHK